MVGENQRYAWSHITVTQPCKDLHLFCEQMMGLFYRVLTEVSEEIQC